MDPRGTIVRVNRAFCEMTGRTAEALTGQTPPYTFWPTEHLDELRFCFCHPGRRHATARF